MPRLFGTDGVRGLANQDLTVELALGLAQAAAVVLGKGRVADGRRASGRRPVAVVARDPRVSGEFIAAAVAAGLASSGVDVYDAGVIPTPALAFLIDDFNADFGVMISASHNPAPDNGIKFFAVGGTKLPDIVEDRIEAALKEQKLAPTGVEVGRIRRFADAEDRYVVHLLATLPHRLDGIHVVLDCANGAASGVSPEVFTVAGARVTLLGADPDGYNINDGVGSTHLDNLAAAVLEHGADVGIAHDGDADRCLAVDHLGRVVDGDQIMAVLAISMKERGVLADNTLVATVMSNLGLRVAMAEHGISVVQTAVGDRYVLETLNDKGLALGGEQSGHVIMSEFATTGDGILTGLHLLAEMARTGKSLAELASVMTVYPQILVNVRGVDRRRTHSDEVLAQAVRDAEAELGETGRVLLRASGTESLVRVMVEAADQATADELARSLADVVRERLALDTSVSTLDD
ncbi:MAG: phosphoglucosamine mutase [Lacisediminihabitans sp.]